MACTRIGGIPAHERVRRPDRVGLLPDVGQHHVPGCGARRLGRAGDGGSRSADHPQRASTAPPSGARLPRAAPAPPDRAPRAAVRQPAPPRLRHDVHLVGAARVWPVTRSSVTVAKGWPSLSASTHSRRAVSSSTTGTNGAPRCVARVSATNGAGGAPNSPGGSRTSSRASDPAGNFRCQPSSVPPLRRRSVIPSEPASGPRCRSTRPTGRAPQVPAVAPHTRAWPPRPPSPTRQQDRRQPARRNTSVRSREPSWSPPCTIATRHQRMVNHPFRMNAGSA